MMVRGRRPLLVVVVTAQRRDLVVVGGGDVTGAGDSSETEQSEEDAHYAALGGVQVAVLRARLRENDNEALATVKQSDLAPSTPSAGPAKSAAVKELLRRRLARVLAES